jgi:hypothetical protein
MIRGHDDQVAGNVGSEQHSVLARLAAREPELSRP